MNRRTAPTVTRITLQQSIGDLFNSMEQTQLDGVALDDSVRRSLALWAAAVRDAFPSVEVRTVALFRDEELPEHERIRVEQEPAPSATTTHDAFDTEMREYDEALATIRELESELWDDGERWIVYETTTEEGR